MCEVLRRGRGSQVLIIEMMKHQCTSYWCLQQSLLAQTKMVFKVIWGHSIVFRENSASVWLSTTVFVMLVNTYTTSRLRVNYLCIFLLNTVDKLAFYMYVFLIYGCVQKYCLRLICLSSIAHTYSINISDVNLIGPSYRVNQLGLVSISSSQILTLLVSRARYPVRELHDVTRVTRDWIFQHSLSNRQS